MKKSWKPLYTKEITMNKEALYYTNPDCFSFSAEVLSCTQTKDGYVLTLSEDGFYPEGGGQPSDRGFIY